MKGFDRFGPSKQSKSDKLAFASMPSHPLLQVLSIATVAHINNMHTLAWISADVLTLALLSKSLQSVSV